MQDLVARSIANKAIVENANKMGVLSELQTTDKTSIVKAINESAVKLAEKATEISILSSVEVNAKTYCVGDGVTDDTLNLRTAIENTPIGGTLVISHPIYITDTVESNKRISIKCVGKGVIKPSQHTNTAFIIGDKTGVLRYHDIDIDLLILGQSSTRTYGLILQNISNSRIKANVMCGGSYGIMCKGLLVNDVKLMAGNNYFYSHPHSMPTLACVRLEFSSVAGGYEGGNNANNYNLVLEGGTCKGLLIEDHLSQGDNFIVGTIQGTAKGLEVTRTMGMTLRDLHIEANTQKSVLTGCISTDLSVVCTDDFDIDGCNGTTINTTSVKNLTISNTSKATTINSLTLIEGGSFIDNAKDTKVIGAISKTNGTAEFVESAFSYHKNGVNQTINDTTPTILTLTTTEFDVKNESVFVSHAFKPKRIGKYRLTAYVNFTTVVDPSKIKVMLYKNGTLYKSAVGLSINTIANVSNSNNDYFQIYVSQTTGASLTIDGSAAQTYFCGSEI